MSFRPSEQTASLFFLQKSALPLGYAQLSETPKRRSGRPDSNRHVLRVGSIRVDETRAHARSRTGITPRTKRVLDHREAWAGTHAGHACGEDAAPRRLRAPKSFRSSGEAISWSRTNQSWMRVGPLPSERELQREESNLRDGRLTGGCLTIRLRWKKSARRAAWSNVLRVRGRAFVRQVFRERGRRTRSCDALVPGTGVEPVFLDSETSVLPARRSRSAPRRATEVARRSCGSGGSRTLTTSIKNRVRLPVALRTRERTRGITARAGEVGREGVEPSSLGVKARCSARLS